MELIAGFLCLLFALYCIYYFFVVAAVIILFPLIILFVIGGVLGIAGATGAGVGLLSVLGGIVGLTASAGPSIKSLLKCMPSPKAQWDFLILSTVIAVAIGLCIIAFFTIFGAFYLHPLWSTLISSGITLLVIILFHWRKIRSKIRESLRNDPRRIPKLSEAMLDDVLLQRLTDLHPEMRQAEIIYKWLCLNEEKMIRLRKYNPGLSDDEIVYGLRKGLLVY